MRPLSEQEIRTAFVNCTKGEAKRLSVPRDLADRPWDDLDYLGWWDPRAPERAYLVTERDGRPTALALRRPAPTTPHQRPRGMCSICLTPHAGVVLMVAPRAGRAGKEGNSVGVHLCGDLCCSLYVRGRKDPGGGRLHETLTEEEKIRRTAGNLAAFVARVTG